jgi:hypothetical protein
LDVGSQEKSTTAAECRISNSKKKRRNLGNFVRFCVHNFAVFTLPGVYRPPIAHVGYYRLLFTSQLLGPEDQDLKNKRKHWQLWREICTPIANI